MDLGTFHSARHWKKHHIVGLVAYILLIEENTVQVCIEISNWRQIQILSIDWNLL
jgi:hypothetical protein